VYAVEYHKRESQLCLQTCRDVHNSYNNVMKPYESEEIMFTSPSTGAVLRCVVN